MFGYYYSCTNMILKDYCPYHHVEDVRKAFHTQTNYIEEGQKPDINHIYSIATNNAPNEEVATFRKMLLNKYPGYPADNQEYFVNTILSNPKHRKKAEEVVRQERLAYKQEQQASKVRRDLR